MDNPLKDLSGGITFSAPQFSFGDSKSMSIGSGLSFDLPLASVAAFQNSALSFQQNNTANNQAFLGNIIQRSQNQVTSTADTVFGLQQSAIDSIRSSSNKMNETLQLAIRESKPKSGCFITTAWAKTSYFDGVEFTDSCYELNTLRKFRDEFMLANADKYAHKIKQYYKEAPAIVESLDNMEDSDDIYLMLGEDYIKPAVRAIENGHYQIALEIYESLFKAAKVIAGVDNG